MNLAYLPRFGLPGRGNVSWGRPASALLGSAPRRSALPGLPCRAVPCSAACEMGVGGLGASVGEFHGVPPFLRGPSPICRPPRTWGSGRRRAHRTGHTGGHRTRPAAPRHEQHLAAGGAGLVWPGGASRHARAGGSRHTCTCPRSGRGRGSSCPTLVPQTL